MKSRRNDIERYLRGALSAAEMHALEKEALNDPFLAEALEGVEQTGADNFLFDLHVLSRSVHDRARGRKSRTIRMWGWTAAIAATLLLVAVSGFLVVTILRDQQAREEAMERESTPIENPGAQIDTLAGPSENPTASASPQKASPQEKASADKDRAGASGLSSETLTEQKTDDDGHRAGPDLLAENDLAESQELKKTDRTRRSEIPDITDDVAVEEIPQTESEQQNENETASAARLEEDAAKRRVQASGQEREKAADMPQAPATVSVSLKGKVVSAEDGEGLPGVTVMVKGTSIGSVTDAAGNYTITPPSLDSKLLFSFVGFETEEVAAAGRNEINVKLKADVDQLNEVVVTGYGSPSSTVKEAASFRIAEPEGGKAALKRYLLKSLRYPQEALKNKVEGKVTVRFTVQPDGVLTDFDVLKGIGSGCDEELIRLIREGPVWKPATQGDTPVAEKVKVRFRFELPR